MQLAEMKRENDELKQKLKEKNYTSHSSFQETKGLFNQNQTISSTIKQFAQPFENKDSEPTQNLEKIEEIGIREGNKYCRVLIKNLYLLKEKINTKTKSENIRNLTHEFDIMNMLDHPNILKAENMIINDDEHPSIIFENCPNNLEEAIQNKSLSKIQQIFSIYQISEGMKFIHSHQIAHLNLKPSSIYISSNGLIKIGEFEHSQIMKSTNDEQMKKMTDVFQFGDVVYFILNGGEDTEIKNEKDLATFSLLGQQLIEACWSAESGSRPTFEIIVDVLEKNDFNLISLSRQESQELSKMIAQYKTQLPI